MTAAKANHETESVVRNLRQNSPAASLPAGPETILNTMAASQRAMFAFVRMRLEKDGDTARQIIGCRNWTDAVEVQSRWVQDMLQDYSAEMTRMMSIYTGQATEGAHSNARRE